MTNRIRFLAIALLCAGAAAAGTPSWHLTWADDFDGPVMSLPDASKWSYDAGGGGWGNNEEEVYCAAGSDKAPCDSKNPNVYLDGSGHLIIKAIEAGGKWTSGRIHTADHESAEYGRIEARMKLPQGAGVWPAFWMLGSNIRSAGWPACGEVDIMENVPLLGATKIQSTIHGPKSGGTGTGLPFTLPAPAQVDTGFHTYGVVWTPGHLQFYVDDFEHPFFTVTRETALAGDWVYDHPFFLLLNLAIGGRWPGYSNATTPRPTIMSVDWVRVYELVK